MTIEELHVLVAEMCGLCARGEFVPLLEADVMGFVYHLILVRDCCTLSRVHLDTRVVGGSSDNAKYDIVIGDVQETKGMRPACLPETVVEMKVFPTGFTNQQHRVHFNHILDDDLMKLGALHSPQTLRVQLIFDEVNYLRGTYYDQPRRKVVSLRRDEVAPGVHLLLARKVRGTWQVSIE